MFWKTPIYLSAGGFIFQEDCDVSDVVAGQQGQLGSEELVDGWH